MRPGGSRIFAAAVVLAALAGCAGCDTVPPSAVTDCNAQIVPGGAATDILFVVDDSGSMTDKQQALADNLSAFIDALVASPVALNLQVGVTNTSIDDYASSTPPNRTAYGSASGGVAFPGPRGTPFPVGTLVAIQQDGAGVGQFGHFLWGSAWDPVNGVSTWGGPRLLASGPTLARDFKANVHQGDWGSGKEQPLRAMRASLDAAMVTTGANQGFLRAGARLAVVILTDEDDCSESATPKHITSDDVCHATNGQTTPLDSAYFDAIDGFVDYLDTTVGALSGQPPIVAVIAGFNASGAASGCTGSGFSSSANPRRLGAFLDRLEGAHPLRTDRLSICQPFGDALLSVASMLIPQTLPLKQSPADYRMMVVSVIKASGAVVSCPITADAQASGAGVVYTPAPPGGDPTLTFQGACQLELGDKIDIKILCAG
jgi:hypothetical protein